jgi:hypothetical protein
VPKWLRGDLDVFEEAEYSPRENCGGMGPRLLRCIQDGQVLP